ncbi:pyridoxal phosphate-dependent decarboxylase family protein [Photobacterium angustum]|uniref:pyridoxal phosphate-dependent decarboxylase family protein n=1 Tax=Photobacterium angustum TaxID=661 RepID=UPI0005E757BE|nr:pyridoxal-dependent decarboxylase [Photobacterium angustum]KJG00947.1 decarboxylase [Photobacterium angustum]KJG16442.1 decarboxylase [Photobacterium angustum]KJG22556.1 decarboxylase [Photobacterium angustum]KJG29424.1 decarboxylase [Photobacterium angustum]PSV63786.1 tyrosine decarboxylase [Photobacterium angustum]
MNTINNKALFLGINAENHDFFEKKAIQLLNDHCTWRKNFHSDDRDIITKNDKEEISFIDTENKISDVLNKMSVRLQESSTPWHSPRYLGHMNAETLTPALLGYFGAMLYNANNVAYESSAPTSVMEMEVGEDLCQLMGMQDNGWAHICTDGSIANFEGLWYARNIKSLPLAIKEIEPELVEGKTDWELMNLPISEILNLFEKSQSKIDILKNNSARAISDEIPKLGKWIVPETKHYSWLKAADVLGIGTNNIIQVAVDNHYRMDINKLKQIIDENIASQTPILGIVCVVGTTEEGAIDQVDKIIELKNNYSKDNINFYFHIDAAYGGYARSIFLDENNNFIDNEKLQDKYQQYNVFSHNINWPSDDVYNAFKAMSQADSITIDPHKMGYVPYAAGGIVIKDLRMKDSISYFASYVFEKGVKVPALLGSFIMEGSKAGATAAAVWAAHQTLPLNITGYGKLIGASVEGAYNLYNHIVDKKFYNINGINVQIEALTKPDFNMVDFILNVEGNEDLAVMNKLNEDIYNMSSIFSGHIYQCNFLTSHTDFSSTDYGNAPKDVINRLHINSQQWDKVQNITLLRACVLTPYLNDVNVLKDYMKIMDDDITMKLNNLINK